MRKWDLIREYVTLAKLNIFAWRPFTSGVTKIKREQEVVISLTSYPARIGSAYKTIRSLLHQDYLPDRVVLWLAEEQFPNHEGVPQKVLELQKYGLEIRWYHDIRSYKKLIPALIAFPDALIVTVDDDWYYRRDMLRVLIEEHAQHLNEIICHTITHPTLNEHKRLVSGNDGTKDTSSFYNKILGSGGILYPPMSLDQDILNENLFMVEAPTNDDIWFWAMAVKHGTKIRLAKNALGNALMTDAKSQLENSLGIHNSTQNLYEKVTNRMLELYPEILHRLLEEKEAAHE